MGIKKNSSLVIHYKEEINNETSLYFTTHVAGALTLFINFDINDRGRISTKTTI